MKLELDTRLSLAFLCGLFLTLGHAIAVTLFSVPLSEPILATGSGLMLATSAALLIKSGPSPSASEDSGPEDGS